MNDETEIIPAVGRHAQEPDTNWQPRPSYLTPSELSATRVLVLGGTSGIGKACARYAANMGVIVEAAGREHYDVRDYAELRKHIFELRPTHVVYSVGVSVLNWTRHAQRADFITLMQINVWGFLETLQLLQDLHAETTLSYRPSVVAVSADTRPSAGGTTYAACSAALNTMVQGAAHELARYGWRINAVAPGMVLDTPMSRYMIDRQRQILGWGDSRVDDLASQNALGSPATVDEVAQVVMDVLFGPMSLNGAIVEVNGGR